MKTYGNRREEVEAVKTALAAAGINARVKHETGTSWGWLRINIGSGQQWGEHTHDGYGYGNERCLKCVNLRAMHETALRVAKAVTGRTGEHAGRINILSQDRWDERRGCSVPIEHPQWKAVVPAGAGEVTALAESGDR